MFSKSTVSTLRVGCVFYLPLQCLLHNRCSKKFFDAPSKKELTGHNWNCILFAVPLLPPVESLSFLIYPAHLSVQTSSNYFYQGLSFLRNFGLPIVYDSKSKTWFSKVLMSVWFYMFCFISSLYSPLFLVTSDILPSLFLLKSQLSFQDPAQ